MEGTSLRPPRGVFGLLAILLATSPVAAQLGQDTKPGSRDHVLLVGCTKYVNLPEELSLNGCENDARLMRDALIEVLDVARADIRLLTGWSKKDASVNPSRKNIVGWLTRTAEAARPGDRVIVFLAGHGSWQPNVGDDIELDRTDELFLPADAKIADIKRRRFVDCITDDELGGYIRAIRDQGAFVWLIMDCCHSGTGMRGAGDAPDEDLDIRARRIRPRDVGIDETMARSLEAPRPAKLRPLRANDLDNIVAMYGAQASDEAKEMKIGKGRHAKHHGIFTYNLVHGLRATRGNVTFGELSTRTRVAYETIPSAGTFPEFEGKGMDTMIRGDGGAPGPRLSVSTGADAGEFQLNGGRLTDVREGDVFAIYAAGKRGQKGAIVGRVEVVDAGPTESTCRVQGRRFKLVDTICPAERISAAPRDDALQFTFGSGPLPTAIGRALEDHKSRVRHTDDASAASWNVVDLDGGGYRIDSRRGMPRSFTVPSSRAAVDRLVEIAHAQNLVKTARLDGKRLAREFEVRVIAYDDNGAPRRLGPTEIMVPGTRFALDVRNRTKQDLYAYAFWVDAEYTITKLYPEGGSAGIPKRSRRLRIPLGKNEAANSMVMLDTTLGLESIVVMAFAKDQGPLDWIAQAPTVRTRGDKKKESELDGGFRVLDFDIAWPRLKPPEWLGAKRAPVPAQPDDTTGRPRIWQEGLTAGFGAIDPDRPTLDLLLMGQKQPTIVLWDVDRDSPEQSIDVAVEKRRFDAEIALRFAADHQAAFYDTDADGEFDLILVDEDLDQRAETRWQLQGGKWVKHEGAEAPWFRIALLGLDPDQEDLAFARARGLFARD